MKPFAGLHGFGSFLEEEEDVVQIFRQQFTYALSRMVFQGVLWWGWAWVAWFFYPYHLFYLWLGLFAFGAIRMLGILLWWYYNAILVTTMNVIFIHWEKPTVKSITRIDYWNLDEIQVVKSGIGAFMYNYGDLVFNKLSGGDPITFTRVGDPSKISTIIDDYKENAIHERNFSQDVGVKDLLQQVISRHIDGNDLPGPPSLQHRISQNVDPEPGTKNRLYRTKLNDFIPWRSSDKQNEEEATEEEIIEKTATTHQMDDGVHHHHYYGTGHMGHKTPLPSTRVPPMQEPPRPIEIDITQEGRIQEGGLFTTRHIDEDTSE